MPRKKYISSIGKEEKRVFTTADGTLLSIQRVFKGKIKTSLPNGGDSERKFLMYGLNSANHWSNLSTTYEYVECLLLERIKRINDGNADARYILLIDCWKIHKSA